MTNLISAILKLDFLSGFRTYVAAIGAFALGVYLITEGQVEEGLLAISGALAALGLGEKSKKTDKAIEEKIKELENKITR